EGDNIFQSTYGPMNESVNVTKNGVPSPSNFFISGGNIYGYQAYRASGIVKSFLSPLDYSIALNPLDASAPNAGSPAPASYLANYSLFFGTEVFGAKITASAPNFNQITDGLSNTMFYAEGLSFPQAFYPRGLYKWMAYSRVWNY